MYIHCVHTLYQYSSAHIYRIHLSFTFRFLTGQVDKRTLEKYEREAKEKNRETWYLSWALDTNQEERDKVLSHPTCVCIM